MKKRQNLEAGFTMIEMLIVIAIMGILAGIAAGSLSLITAGNAKKSAARFNNALNEAQVQTMSLKNPTYLYLYRASNGRIMAATSSKKCDSRTDLDNEVDNMKTREVGDKAITIKFILAADGSIATSDVEKELGDDQMLRIVYRKDNGAYNAVESGHFGSGGLQSNLFIKEIQFLGKAHYKVKMVEETGKHYVEK